VDASLFHAHFCARGEKRHTTSGREQQTGGRAGLIPSVKQPRCRRTPALGQPGDSRFLIQVSEYLVEHHRVFDEKSLTKSFIRLIEMIGIDPNHYLKCIM
jgi:hypothetical protein